MIPKWYSSPNEVMTAEDIMEMLEYERAQLEACNDRIDKAKGEHDLNMAILDVQHSKLRISQLERLL